MSATIACGISPRGLSSVMTMSSASSAAIVAHQRPLARIAIAAAAEHDVQPAAAMLARGAQRLAAARPACARSRRSRAARRAPPNSSMRPLGARHARQRACAASASGTPSASRHREHGEHVVDIEIADQRHVELAAPQLDSNLDARARESRSHVRGAHEPSALRTRVLAGRAGDDEAPRPRGCASRAAAPNASSTLMTRDASSGAREQQRLRGAVAVPSCRGNRDGRA